MTDLQNAKRKMLVSLQKAGYIFFENKEISVLLDETDKFVIYNDLKNSSIHCFRDGMKFKVLKETKKTFKIQDEKNGEHTIFKSNLEHFTFL